MKHINFRELSSFVSIVLLSISLTRIWSMNLYYIFAHDPGFIEAFSSDPWHHYQVWLLIIVVAYLLRKVKNTKIAYAVGIGMFLEEWPVFLNDLGFDTNSLYHSWLDFIAIMGVVGIIYMISRVLERRNAPS